MQRILFISKSADEKEPEFGKNFDGTVIKIDNTEAGLIDDVFAELLKRLGVFRLPAIVLMPFGADECKKEIKKHWRKSDD